MDLGLAGRVAIVTGASRGIGRRIAVDLAAEGCDLVLCARSEEALRAAAGDVERHGRRAVVVAADLSDPDAAQAIVAEAVQGFGRLDILVNNAGGAKPKRLERLTDDDWREGFEVNFFAAARLAGAATVPMREAGWGRVVNIASTYGREPDPAYAPYGAAKAALINLTKSLARAYSSEGVLCTCVVPGVTRTELVEANAEALADRTGTTPDAVMDQVMARDPVAAGRFGLPEDISAAVVFLSSAQASWITGAVLAVDGSTLRGI